MKYDLIAQWNSLVAVNAKHIEHCSAGVISTQLAAWSFLQCCGDFLKIETLSFFAFGGDGFETQVKKIIG